MINHFKVLCTGNGFLEKKSILYYSKRREKEKPIPSKTRLKSASHDWKICGISLLTMYIKRSG